MIIVNPLLSPLGAYLFQAHLRWGGGGLIETWGLFERQGAYLIWKRRWYRFSIEN